MFKVGDVVQLQKRTIHNSNLLLNRDYIVSRVGTGFAGQLIKLTEMDGREIDGNMSYHATEFAVSSKYYMRQGERNSMFKIGDIVRLNTDKYTYYQTIDKTDRILVTDISHDGKKFRGTYISTDDKQYSKSVGGYYQRWESKSAGAGMWLAISNFEVETTSNSSDVGGDTTGQYLVVQIANGNAGKAFSGEYSSKSLATDAVTKLLRDRPKNAYRIYKLVATGKITNIPVDWVLHESTGSAAPASAGSFVKKLAADPVYYDSGVDSEGVGQYRG